MKRNLVQSGKFLIDTGAGVVMIGDKEIPFHKKMTGNNISVAGNHLIIDGYKLMPDDTWRHIHKTTSTWEKLKSLLGG